MLNIVDNLLLEPIKVLRGGQLYNTVQLLDRLAVNYYLQMAARIIFQLAEQTTGTLWTVEIWQGAKIPAQRVREVIRRTYSAPEYAKTRARLRWTHVVAKGGGRGKPAVVTEPSPDRTDIHPERGDRVCLFDPMIDTGSTSIAVLAENYIPDDSPMVCLFNRDCPKLEGSATILGAPFLVKPLAFPEAQLPDQPPVFEPPFVFGSGPNLDESDDGELTRHLEELHAGPWECVIATVDLIASVETLTALGTQ